MRNIGLATDEIYHVCNRAVEGRNIFIRDKDNAYFLENLLIGNTESNLDHHWRRNPENLEKIKKNPLVEISCLCLMPNHFHIIMRQLVDNGIAKLMQRSCNSFAKYTNAKYERKGSLFMGPYKAMHISSENYATHLFTYIHANPLDLILPKWRDGELSKSDWGRAKKFLKNYRYSSLPIFLCDKGADPLIKKLISTDLADTYYQDPKDYLSTIYDWSLEDYINIHNTTLE